MSIHQVKPVDKNQLFVGSRCKQTHTKFLLCDGLSICWSPGNASLITVSVNSVIRDFYKYLSSRGSEVWHANDKMLSLAFQSLQRRVITLLQSIRSLTVISVDDIFRRVQNDSKQENANHFNNVKRQYRFTMFIVFGHQSMTLYHHSCLSE